MKILILGGSGLVGSTLAQSLKTENEIHVTFNTHNIDENFSKTQMNLLNDYEKLDNLIDEFEPNVIVNTIAYPNVDFCEKNPEISYKTNVIAVSNLVNWCLKSKKKIKFIYISTDQIYNRKINQLPREISFSFHCMVWKRSCLEMPQKINSGKQSFIKSRHFYFLKLRPLVASTIPSGLC